MTVDSSDSYRKNLEVVTYHECCGVSAQAFMNGRAPWCSTCGFRMPEVERVLVADLTPENQVKMRLAGESFDVICTAKGQERAGG